MVTRPKPLHNPCGGDLSLDFTNSIGRGVAGGRMVLENERLTDYPALLRWTTEAGALRADQGRALERLAARHARAARNVLARAVALREAIFAVFHADVRGETPPAAELATLNAELSRALAHARIEPTEDGYAWTLTHSLDALGAPLWPIVRAAADLLVSPNRERVRACASDSCLWLFLDRTRNRGRRWCEMKGCGNRAKVRQHRRRCREARASE